ncbi:phage tail tape measure protein [Limimaricola pyoseonensis]|uniref:Phage tail tape measure protein, lambda family n=1 Tax=Limimaricola pyoseonensis TaxID=521013 RepID=A0A1G7AWC2_9RHOB|nr:phage tail tape measure protein [Limimaricola pyoseonensis]SDE19168.1 hypothetical protein SAMN04488567_1139 [Limimaricola pyoseonensis]
MTEDEIEALERALGDAGGMADRFAADLARMRREMAATSRDVSALQRGFSGGIRRAVDSVLLGGQGPGEALRGLAGSVARTAYGRAMRPVTDRLGGALAEGVGALMGFANGAAFAGGRVVTGPTPVAMRGGAGVMGEAGPEAVMPLSRGPDGRLGVAAQAGQPVAVTVHIATPDAESFRRSRGQVAAGIARAVARGQRNR